MNIDIRTGTDEDAGVVADIYISSRERHVAFAPLAHANDGVRRWIRDVLLPGGKVRVATVDGAVVGMVANSHDEGLDWIDHLYVAPDLVGKGIGAALLRDALGGLGRPVRLWTFQDNHGARRFYKRNGCRELELTNGESNEEKCPDVLCELL